MTFPNRGMTWAVALAAFALAGAACEQSVPPPDAGGTTGTEPDDDDGMEKEYWVSYDSEVLGTDIAHPGGWYAVEDVARGSIVMHPSPPLPLDVATDAIARVRITRGPFTVEDAVRSYGPAALRASVEIADVEMVLLTYETELGAPPGSLTRQAVYLWSEDDDGTVIVQGSQESDVVREVVARIVERSAP